jgi:hypothetical protein
VSSDIAGDYSDRVQLPICENRWMGTEKKISYPFVSNLPDADMQSAPRGLLRAAQRAREVARATRTPLVIVIDGVLTHVPWDQIEDIELSPEDKELMRRH